MSHAIELRNVSKRFQQFEAVKDLSFKVNQGVIYGFLGPNGSGKSTTLRMMMGLIQPTTGSILFNNQSISSHRKEIMQRIGCMIEKPDFYGYLSALTNLKICARASQLDIKEKDFEALLEKVGLNGRGRDKVKTFSHGMKQRLGLAQVLIHNPDIIILDEPNTGLDPQGILDLRNLILSLNQEDNKTILFSSHILSEVQEICTDMIVINKGKTVAEGKVSQLLSEELLAVTIEVLEQDLFNRYIQQSQWNQFLAKGEHHDIVLNLGKPQIANLTKDMVAQGFSIIRVEYKNPLEEYFLKITQSQ